MVDVYEGSDALYPQELKWYQYLDIATLIYYLVEFAVQLLSRQHRLTFLLTYTAVVDIATIVPIFLIGRTDKAIVIIIKICRVFRFLRLVRFVFTFNKLGETEVSRQFIKIILTLLSLILFSACVLEAVENPDRNDGTGANSYGKYVQETTSIHEMIYFVVVTLATVGYGDVVPESEGGRVAVILLILFTIVLIPMQTNDLIRLMGLQSYYARVIYKYNSEVPHLLVTGYVSVLALKDFSVELFHPDHGSQDKNAVILQQKDPSVEMQAFLHHPQYELFLTYLRGNQMSERDLKRASAVEAKACVILTKKYANDSHIIDHKNILTGLAIKKYVNHITGGKNMRLIMQLIKPESKTHYYSSLNRKSNDQLIIIEEIKMNLLAKSCFSPGIISMLSNLITSAGDIAIGNDDKEWMKEYTTGMGYEIYRADLSHKFQGKKFSEVAAIVYNEFQGILFGLELDVSGQTIIRLNPGNYSIPHTMENKIHVYMICEDKKVADQVSCYEMTTEEIATYQQQKNQFMKKKQKKLEKQQNDEDSEGDDAFESDMNSNYQEDNELLESDYTLLSDPLNLMQVTRISIQDHSDITNHIVVCGIHPSIYYFLLPLRASYLTELQYVVILSPDPPSNDIWEGLNRFPKIIYIKGSPLVDEDLQRANIGFADKAVILGRDMAGPKSQILTDNDDGMLDAESIFIYRAIKRCNKNVQIMIELMHSSNSEFLLPPSMKSEEKGIDFDAKCELTPLFAAGEIYISSIIDTLTSQAYYNPHIVTIMQQILTGGKQSNNVIRTICELAELKQSNLWQISIPEDYLNKTFGELFNYLTVERELLPLGLYRLPGATDNQHPYVYTNPEPSTKLSHRDKVFVLAANMSQDLLMGDIHAQTKGEGAGGVKGLTSHTNLSDYKDEGKPKILDDGNSRLKELSKYQIQVPNMQNRNNDANKNGKGNHQLDLENLNQNSMTAFVLEQIGSALGSMQTEIDGIKQKLTLQNEQILDKVKAGIRQELSTIGR